VFTQAELNKIPPPPDPENFWALELNKTVPVVVQGDTIDVAITLRRIENGIAYVQLTYRVGSRLREIPRTAVRSQDN
jgi:hypothetical protein